MSEIEKKKTDELSQISVPTKTITFSVTDKTKVEIILRPFKQRHFPTAIKLIHKYFDSYNSVRIGYNQKRKQIIDQYSEEKDEKVRNQALKDYDESFNEGMEVAKAILTTGDAGIGEDIKTLVGISVIKSTKILELDEGIERSSVELDLDDLTWGECMILFGSTIGLNIDFFAQNAGAMNLTAIIENPAQNPEEAEPKQIPNNGEKLLAA